MVEVGDSAPEVSAPLANGDLGETFTLSDPRGEDDEEEKGNQNYADADSFFNLPDDDDDEGEDKDERG